MKLNIFIIYEISIIFIFLTINFKTYFYQIIHNYGIIKIFIIKININIYNYNFYL